MTFRNRASKSRRNRTALHTATEAMEQRQMLTADVLGVTRGNGEWLLNTERGIDSNSTPEIDARFGLAGDTYVVGNWFGEDDRMGVVRDHRDGFARWYFDEDGDPTHEAEFLFGLNDFIPVVGDWDGDGTSNMGSIELAPDGFMRWHLDLNGDPTAEQIILYGLNTDVPVVGDWDNDGTDEIGVYRPDVNGFGHWLLNTDDDPAAEIDRLFGLAGDEPVVGDFDGDGNTDIAVARKEGDFKRWYFDTNNDNQPEPNQPIYGLASDVAVAGNWKLPEANLTYANRSIPLNGNVNFGIKMPGEFGNRNFYLHNTGNAPLAVNHAGTDGNGVKVTGAFELVDGLPTSIEPGAKDRIIVRLKDNTKTGVRRGKLIINTNDGNEPRHEIDLIATVETPEIHIDRHSSGRVVRLGSVVEGKARTVLFKVQNKNRVPLTINGVSHSGNVQLTRQLPGVIGPRSSANLGVSVSTSRRGSFEGTVRIQNNDPNESDYLIRLRWTVEESLPEIEVKGISDGQSKPIDFGLAYADETHRRRTFTVSNVGNDDLTTSVAVPNGYRVVEPLDASIAPGESDTFRVELMKENSVGTYNGEIRITTNDKSNPVFNFRVVGRVDLSPPEINVIGIPDGQRDPVEFGTTTVGSAPISKTFDIRNNGRKNLVISQVAVPSGFQVVSRPTTVLPGEVRPLTVKLLTTQARTRQGDIVIRNNDADEGIYNFRVRGVVTRQIQGPELEVRYNGRVIGTGSQIDFGAMVGTETRTRQFEIRNTGGQNLQISNLAIPDGYTISNLLNGQIIGPNRVRTVTVRATSALGEKIGNLSFTTNDSDERLFELPLRGKRFEAIQRVTLSSATSVREHSFSVSTEKVNRGYRVEIAPAHGRTPLNGVYVITKWDPDLQFPSRQVFTSLLNVVNISGTGSSNVEVVNWTNLTVRRR